LHYFKDEYKEHPNAFIYNYLISNMNDKITEKTAPLYALCEIPKPLQDLVESFYIVPLRAKFDEGGTETSQVATSEDRYLKQKLNVSIVRDNDYLIGIIVPRQERSGSSNKTVQLRGIVSSINHNNNTINNTNSNQSPNIDASCSDSNISTASSCSASSTTLSGGGGGGGGSSAAKTNLPGNNNNLAVKEQATGGVSVPLKRKSPEPGPQPSKKVNFDSSNQGGPIGKPDAGNAAPGAFKKPQNASTNSNCSTNSASHNDLGDDWNKDDVFDPFNNKDYDKHVAKAYEKRAPQPSSTSSSTSSANRDPRLARQTSQVKK
jgi:hypothetical protein